MQSKTFLFNPALFRKNLTRFWPIWAAYGLAWVLLLPGRLFSDYMNGYLNYEVDSHVMKAASLPGIVLAFVFGCISALAVFSYLYQHRSAVAMHAFPLRRECLFITNYLSGLAFCLFPLAVVFVLTWGVEGLCGQVNVSGLLVWLTAQISFLLFFYSFAVFCAMFTGNAFAMPVFYGILSVLAVVLAMLADEAFRQFVYGYVTSSRLESVARIFSPVIKLMTEVNGTSRELESGTLWYMTGWGWILLYSFVGIVLAVVALAIYRLHQVETAGDVVSVKQVKPLFKYGVAVSAALTGGAVLFELFFYSDRPYSAGIMLALMIVCGLVGYFVAQMLLDKSFRVFSAHWKGAVALAAALALLVGGVYYDPFRIVSAIPKADQVASVDLSHIYVWPDGYRSCTITDPELIQQMVELHQTVVNQRSETQEKLASLSTAEKWEENHYQLANGDWTYVINTDSYYFQIDYNLNNGRVTRRAYEIYVSQAELDDPDSPAARLLALISAEIQGEELMSGHTEEQLVGADINNVWNATTQEWDDLELDQSQARMLYQAVLRDWSQGKMDEVWLTESQDCMANVCYTTIEFEFTYEDESGETNVANETVTLRVGMDETIAALQEVGVLDEDHQLRTELEEVVWQYDSLGIAAEEAD